MSKLDISDVTMRALYKGIYTNWRTCIEAPSQEGFNGDFALYSSQSGSYSANQIVELGFDLRELHDVTLRLEHRAGMSLRDLESYNPKEKYPPLYETHKKYFREGTLIHALELKNHIDEEEKTRSEYDFFPDWLYNIMFYTSESHYPHPDSSRAESLVAVLDYDGVASGNNAAIARGLYIDWNIGLVCSHYTILYEIVHKEIWS